MQHGTTRADVVKLWSSLFVEVDDDDREALESLHTVDGLTDDRIFVAFFPPSELDRQIASNEQLPQFAMTGEDRDVRWRQLKLGGKPRDFSRDE
jgi:hypothetical protein